MLRFQQVVQHVVERIREPLIFIPGLDGAAVLVVTLGDIVHQRPQLADRPQDHPLKDRIKRHHRTNTGQQSRHHDPQTVHKQRPCQADRGGFDNNGSDLLVLGKNGPRTLFAVTLQAAFLGSHQANVVMHHTFGFAFDPSHITNIRGFTQKCNIAFLGLAKKIGSDLFAFGKSNPCDNTVVFFQRTAGFGKACPGLVVEPTDAKMGFIHRTPDRTPRVQCGFIGQLIHPEIGDRQRQNQTKQHRPAELQTALFRQ